MSDRPLTKQQREQAEERRKAIVDARKYRLSRMGEKHEVRCMRKFDQDTRDILDLNHATVHNRKRMSAAAPGEDKGTDDTLNEDSSEDDEAAPEDISRPLFKFNVHVAAPVDASVRASTGARSTVNIKHAMEHVMKLYGISKLPKQAYVSKVVLTDVTNNTRHTQVLQAHHNHRDLGDRVLASDSAVDPAALSHTYLAVAHPMQNSAFSEGQVLYDAGMDKFIDGPVFRKYSPLAHAGPLDDLVVEIPNTLQVEYTSHAAVCVDGKQSEGDLFADLMHLNPKLFKSRIPVEAQERVGLGHQRILNITMAKEDFQRVRAAAEADVIRPIKDHVFEPSSGPEMVFTVSPVMLKSDKPLRGAGELGTERDANGATAWTQTHMKDEQGHVGFGLDVYVQSI